MSLKNRWEIKHSESKSAWNIIGTKPGTKYKIARVPYITLEEAGSQELFERFKAEALQHAELIVTSVNNREMIVESLKKAKNYFERNNCGGHTKTVTGGIAIDSGSTYEAVINALAQTDNSQPTTDN